MNENNFYVVKAKCGHVGRQKFIIKDFPVKASSGKEAAIITRYLPRVKHHWKDAILSVEKISEYEYKELCVKKNNDPYFSVDNIRDQKIYCQNIEVIENGSEIERNKSKRNSLDYRLKKMRIIEESLGYAWKRRRIWKKTRKNIDLKNL